MLAAQALPREVASLKLGQELEEMSAAESHGDLEIVTCRARLTELREVMDEKGPFDVLHYLGHAEIFQGNGALLFEKPDGSVERVDGRRLADKLGDFTKLRLLVLNACRTAHSTRSPTGDPFGSVAAALVRSGFPVVLAMHEVISDDAAIALSRTLYRKLALRQPIEKALAEARQAIYDLNPQRLEWAVPSLFVRASSPSGIEEVSAHATSRDEALRLCNAGVASFWARDYKVSRQKLREALGCEPSLEKARLFDLLAFMALAAPLGARELLELDDELQKLLAAQDPDVARLAKLALGILRFDTSGPRGVRVRGIPSQSLFANLEASERTPLERDLGARLGASRDAGIYFNLRN